MRRLLSKKGFRISLFLFGVSLLFCFAFLGLMYLTATTNENDQKVFKVPLFVLFFAFGVLAAVFLIVLLICLLRNIKPVTILQVGNLPENLDIRINQAQPIPYSIKFRILVSSYKGRYIGAFFFFVFCLLCSLYFYYCKLDTYFYLALIIAIAAFAIAVGSLFLLPLFRFSFPYDLQIQKDTVFLTVHEKGKDNTALFSLKYLDKSFETKEYYVLLPRDKNNPLVFPKNRLDTKERSFLSQIVLYFQRNDSSEQKSE